FFFSSRRRHTRFSRDWSSDVCSSDLCEEAHEAIRRARQQGKRVFGEPLIQHLTLDESEYFNPDWDHAARRVMSPPFRNKKHQDRSEERRVGKESGNRGSVHPVKTRPV